MMQVPRVFPSEAFAAVTMELSGAPLSARLRLQGGIGMRPATAAYGSPLPAGNAPSSAPKADAVSGMSPTLLEGLSCPTT